jgi:hypothetical protein
MVSKRRFPCYLVVSASRVFVTASRVFVKTCALARIEHFPSNRIHAFANLLQGKPSILAAVEVGHNGQKCV